MDFKNIPVNWLKIVSILFFLLWITNGNGQHETQKKFCHRISFFVHQYSNSPIIILRSTVKSSQRSLHQLWKLERTRQMPMKLSSKSPMSMNLLSLFIRRWTVGSFSTLLSVSCTNFGKKNATGNANTWTFEVYRIPFVTCRDDAFASPVFPKWRQPGFTLILE